MKKYYMIGFISLMALLLWKMNYSDVRQFSAREVQNKTEMAKVAKSEKKIEKKIFGNTVTKKTIDLKKQQNPITGNVKKESIFHKESKKRYFEENKMTLKKLKEMVRMRGDDPHNRDVLLVDSVMENCLSCVLELIDQGVDITKANSRGESALAQAVGGGNDVITKVLLEHGSDPNIVFNQLDYTLLMDASFEGNLDVVKSLLKAGAEVNMVDRDGKTALIYAAREGFFDVTAYLLKSGAQKKIKDRSGRSALDYAKLYKFQDVIEILGAI